MPDEDVISLRIPRTWWKPYRELANGDLDALEQAALKALSAEMRRHGVPDLPRIVYVLRGPDADAPTRLDRLAEIRRDNAGKPLTALAAQLAARQVVNGGVASDPCATLVASLLRHVVGGNLMTLAQPSMVPTDAFPDYADYESMRSTLDARLGRHAEHFARSLERDPQGTAVRAPRMKRARATGEAMVRLVL